MTTGRKTRGGIRRGTYGSLGAQKHQKMYYDVNAWWREFEVGDLVYQIKDAWIEQEALSSVHRSIRHHQGVVSLSISGGGLKACLGMAS